MSQFCVLCDLRVIEDEWHFLFFCPVYELRMGMFERIQCKKPDFFWMTDGDMLSWLFENEIYSLARYVEKAWKLRQSNLYPGLN